LPQKVELSSACLKGILVIPDSQTLFDLFIFFIPFFKLKSFKLNIKGEEELNLQLQIQNLLQYIPEFPNLISP